MTEYIKHINGYDEVGDYYQVGDRVEIYTPEGDVRGKVIEVKSSDCIVLKVGDRFIQAVYYFSSLAYGPHWRLSSSFDHYNVNSMESWEEYDELFSHGWRKEIINND